MRRRNRWPTSTSNRTTSRVNLGPVRPHRNSSVDSLAPTEAQTFSYCSRTTAVHSSTMAEASRSERP